MAKTLLIYGSLTGNTEGVAFKIQEIAKEKGKDIEVKNAVDADLNDMTAPYDTFILASSTWDDGQVQADFADFIERISSAKPSLAGKKIAVLGCGDSNYAHFCGAVNTIENLFVADMGGEKIIESLRINGYPDMEENQTAIRAWAEKLAELLS